MHQYVTASYPDICRHENFKSRNSCWINLSHIIVAVWSKLYALRRSQAFCTKAELGPNREPPALRMASQEYQEEKPKGCIPAGLQPERRQGELQLHSSKPPPGLMRSCGI